MELNGIETVFKRKTVEHIHFEDIFLDFETAFYFRKVSSIKSVYGGLWKEVKFDKFYSNLLNSKKKNNKIIKFILNKYTSEKKLIKLIKFNIYKLK